MHTATLHEMRRLLESGIGAPAKPFSLKKLPDKPSSGPNPTAPKVDDYEGIYQENKRNGKGTMHYANGDVYVGLWLEDKRNGRGKMTYVNGNVYEGNWEADKMKGVGKFIHHSPAHNEDFDWKFSGEFKNDFPVCGTLTYKENNTCNQSYTDTWTTVDIQEHMPSTTSKTVQKKSRVDPKSDNLSDQNPQETERLYKEASLWKQARIAAEEDKHKTKDNEGYLSNI